MARLGALWNKNVYPQWFMLMTQKTSCCWGSYINIYNHTSSYNNIYHHHINIYHHKSSWFIMCPLATANLLGHNKHLSGPVPPWDVHPTGPHRSWRSTRHHLRSGWRHRCFTGFRVTLGTWETMLANLWKDLCCDLVFPILTMCVCVWILIITYYNFIFNDL